MIHQETEKLTTDWLTAAAVTEPVKPSVPIAADPARLDVFYAVVQADHIRLN